MYDVPLWFSTCPLECVYETSYRSLKCACSGRAEMPQMVYADDNTSLIHQVKFRRNWYISIGSSSVICWMVFHMMTHAPLTWAYEINCYFNGKVIGSHRQISLARRVLHVVPIELAPSRWRRAFNIVQWILKVTSCVNNTNNFFQSAFGRTVVC